MKSKYLFLVASVVSMFQCGTVRPFKQLKPDHGVIRSRLHELLEKRDASTLSLQEVREVRLLIHDLAKFDKKSADHLVEKYIRDFGQCCFSPREFELREADLELQDLFGNPRPHDNSWKHRAQKYLDFYYDAAYDNGCTEDGLDDDGYELPVTKLYKQAAKKYESITRSKHHRG